MRIEWYSWKIWEYNDTADTEENIIIQFSYMRTQIHHWHTSEHNYTDDIQENTIIQMP